MILEAVTPTVIAGTVASEVAPPVVRVRDPQGNPVGGVSVFFEFSEAAFPGTVKTAAAISGADGRATTMWQLGTQVGAYQVRARLSYRQDVVFTAVAGPGPVATVYSTDASQEGPAGSVLAFPLSIHVRDRFSNVIPGAKVTFSVISGGGNISGDTVVTGSDGVATSKPWVLGPAPGEQQAVARVEGFEIVFTARALTAEECGEGCLTVRQLAFVRDGHIHTVNSNGTDLVRLTSVGINSDPAWSPDGRRIAFTSDRNGSVDIYVMDADGSNVVKRTNTGTNDSPTWSPDGRRIAYSGLDGQRGIYVINVDEDWWSPVHRGFERGWNTSPAWSPDGRKIIFTSDWAAFDFFYDVYVMDADGSEPRQLIAGPFAAAGSRDHYFQPAWSPDGTRIAVAICSYGWYTCFPSGIGVANEDGSGLKRIAEAGGFAKPAWSPDGLVIAFGAGPCHACASSIYYVTPDGSRSGLLIPHGHSPAWRPTPRTQDLPASDRRQR